MKAFNKIKKLFESRQAGIICLVIAILNKSIIALLFSSLKADKALYLLFAKTFLETGKLAERLNVVENGSTVYLYDPAIHTPLYSFLCAPFLWITKSYFITQFIVSFLAWTIFFIGLYKLTSLVFRQRWMANLFILFAGFFLYPHELLSGPKDTLATGLTLWSIILLYKFLTGRPHWRTTILFAFLLAGLALTKLIYIPLASLLLFIALIFFLFKRNKQYLLQVGWLIVLLFLIGYVVSTFAFQPAYQLAVNNAISLPANSTQATQGFYPHNLLSTFPFISSSFINTQLWAVQIEKLAGVSFGMVMRAFFVFDVVFLSGLLLLCCVLFKRIIRNKTLLFLVFTSFTMIGVVIYLSLTQKALVYQSATSSWTWVSDARSFLIAMLTLQLVAFIFIFRYAGLTFLRHSFLLLFIFAGVHGLYFTIKNLATTPVVQEANVSNDAVRQIATLLTEKAYTADKLILITSDKHLRRYVQVQNLPAFTFTNLQPDLSWMRRGDRFLIATYKDDSTSLKKFPKQGLTILDTIEPFALHIFVAN